MCARAWGCAVRVCCVCAEVRMCVRAPTRSWVSADAGTECYAVDGARLFRFQRRLEMAYQSPCDRKPSDVMGGYEVAVVTSQRAGAEFALPTLPTLCICVGRWDSLGHGV